jgi:DNA mismatch endonuclease (patch repair protein)
MARIKAQNTGPEIALRKAVWAEGLRYRLHQRLPGRPDLVFVRAKVAVFVDGCFWHSCPLHGHQPKSNQDYWKKKLKRTTQRDASAGQALAALGWLPLRLWEHEVEYDLQGCIERILEAIRLRT